MPVLPSRLHRPRRTEKVDYDGGTLLAPVFNIGPYWSQRHFDLAWKRLDGFARSREPSYRRQASAQFRTERNEIVAIARNTLRDEDLRATRVRVEQKVITEESLRRFIERLGDKYDAYHRDWVRRFRQLNQRSAEIVVGQLQGELGVSFSVFNPRIQELIAERANLLAGRVTDGTFRSIKDTMFRGWREGEGVDQLANRVHRVFGQGYSRTIDGRRVQILDSRQRARLIARTETTAVLNGSSLRSVQVSEVPRMKVWLSQGDERVRPEHLDEDGSRVALDEDFPVTGLPYPQEPNCRCFLVYERKRSGD